MIVGTLAYWVYRLHEYNRHRRLGFGMYLRGEMYWGKIDFHLRANIDAGGRLTFYIHPEGKDGETADFLVKDNYLIRR